MRLVKRLWESYDAIDAARTLLKIGLLVLGFTLQGLGLAHREADTSWLGMWRMFIQTVPLTLAFMLMIPICFEGLKARGAERFFMVVIAPWVILIIATSMAVWWGDLTTVDQPPLIQTKVGWLLVDVVIRGINLLGAYYAAYGPETFWSSLGLAVVLLGTFGALRHVWKSR
jgi:hypothetical protein